MKKVLSLIFVLFGALLIAYAIIGVQGFIEFGIVGDDVVVVVRDVLEILITVVVALIDLRLGYLLFKKVNLDKKWLILFAVINLLLLIRVIGQILLAFAFANAFGNA